MIGDVLLYSSLLHPFTQHHFNRCRGDTELVEHPFTSFDFRGIHFWASLESGIVTCSWSLPAHGDVERLTESAALCISFHFKTIMIAVPQAIKHRKQGKLPFSQLSVRHGVAISVRTSSMVRNSSWLFSFAAAPLRPTWNGLHGNQPLTDSHVQGSSKRFMKMRQVVLPNVFFPLLNVQVLRKAMKPLQKSLSTSFTARLGFPIYNRYCSTLACAFRFDLMLAGVRPFSSLVYFSTQRGKRHPDLFHVEPTGTRPVR